MSKHFILDPNINPVSIEAKQVIQQEEKQRKDSIFSEEDLRAKRLIEQEDSLIHTHDRIVVKVDMENKNFHTFQDGTRIRRERAFNEFNRRITQPTNVIVISGEGIPKDAELLVDHNALHETNRINDYKNTFELAESDRVRYFSIPYYECYAWRKDTPEWTPIWPFEFAMMVYKPYNGLMTGIEPEELKDTLFVTSGNLMGNVVKTLKGCNYCIIYQDTNGRENYLIVFRPNGNSKTGLEEEAIAILHHETEQVLKGNYLIGYSISDAKPLEITKSYIPKDFKLKNRKVKYAD